MCELHYLMTFTHTVGKTATCWHIRNQTFWRQNKIMYFFGAIFSKSLDAPLSCLFPIMSLPFSCKFSDYDGTAQQMMIAWKSVPVPYP